jgi:hypothetical protein
LAANSRPERPFWLLSETILLRNRRPEIVGHGDPANAAGVVSVQCGHARDPAHRPRGFTPRFDAFCPPLGGYVHRRPLPRLFAASAGRAQVAKCTSSWPIMDARRVRFARVLDIAQMYTMWRLHEYLSGVSAQRWPQLWCHLFGSDRTYHRPDIQCAQIQQSAVRFHAQWQLQQRLPCQDQHPRADLRLAS